MQSREILAGALAAAIAIALNLLQKRFGRPLSRRLVQHPRETERDLEEGPAVHSIEVGGGRFDAVVDLKGEGFVRCANQGASHGRCPLPDRERFPVIRASLL